VVIATTRVALSAKLAIMDHAKVAGALTARVSREIAHTALAARVIVVTVSATFLEIATTVLAQVDGAATVCAPVGVACIMPGMMVHIAATTQPGAVSAPEQLPA